MYPQFELFSGIILYTFGLSLSISFVLFFTMLYRLSKKFSINPNFFIGNGLVFFLSTFIVSRLVYIITEWQDSAPLLFSSKALVFFFLSDYNLSFVGGVVGFFGVLLYKLFRYKIPAPKYLDTIVLAFFFAAIVGYIGAFFGGQIYGRPTHMIFGIIYNNADSVNPYTAPVIPLALIYAFCSFILFVVLYIARMGFIKIEGLVGYIGMGIFGAILLVWEFFNGSIDALNSVFILNINQILAILFMIVSVRWVLKLVRAVE